MQMMGRIMPVFLGFISLSIPAGVLVYWVTTNAWQIGQQHFMLRVREQEPAPMRGSASLKQQSKVESKEEKPPKPQRPPQRSGSKNARSRKKRRKR
jgi:YidC/Oxa1 family membrane protein insertase